MKNTMSWLLLRWTISVGKVNPRTHGIIPGLDQDRSVGPVRSSVRCTKR